MKYKILVILALLVFHKDISAQLTPEQRIQDSIIGWWSVLPKKAAAPITKNGYTFSTVQQEHLNEIIRWMYKTYTPVGGLGTFAKKFDADQGIKRYPPHVYGVDFRVWNVTYDKQWMTADGRFKPIDEEYTAFSISANYIPENRPVIFINSSSRYVFTMPPDGSGEEQLKQKRENEDPRIHPNVYAYLTRQSEYQNIFIAPANTLPIKAVSKGDLLDMAESSIEYVLKSELERVQEKFSDPKAKQEAFEYRKKAIEQHRVYIQQLRVKHQRTLEQPAVVNEADLTIYQFDINRDPFDISEIQKQRKQYYIVNQYTKELLDKCRSDQPQWLVITVPFRTRTDGNQEYEMYKTVIENFNYEYAYNYFFDQQKVKGISYRPANEASLTARLNGYRKIGVETAAVSSKTIAPDILFEDDFAGNSVGTSAKGWYSSSTGDASKVATVQNDNGKWLKIGYNNPVTPYALKKPLPKNFSISFDIATDEFSSRTGGAVVLYMSTYPLVNSGAENKNTDGAWIKLSIIAGNANDLTNNNFSGEAKLELHTTPPLFRENFNEGAYFKKSLADFSNQKRKLKVQLTFINGEIQLLINNNLTASSVKDLTLAYGGVCNNCRIPAEFTFNTVRWENFTNNANETAVYISKVKITKL
jgi:hypothetical protein